MNLKEWESKNEKSYEMEEEMGEGRKEEESQKLK